MNGISATGFYGYPNPYQMTATATASGNGLTELNAGFYQHFGLGNVPVYDMTINGAMGGMTNPYAMGMYGMGGMYGMNQEYWPQYLKYLNMDYKDRLAYDYDLRNIAREQYYQEGKDAKNYASATDGLTGSIREACNALQTVVVEGESDQIVEQFERIVNTLRQSPLYTRLQQEFKDNPVMLEMTLRNCAKEQFQAVTGQDLKAMIQQHCDGTVSNAFWNTISFGNAQRYSTEEVIAKIEGSEAPKSEKTRALVGKIGGATATTGAGAAIGFMVGGPIGAVVGGAAGLIAGIIGANC